MGESREDKGEGLVAAWDVALEPMSGQVCAECGEEFGLLEEVVLLQVAYPVEKGSWILAEGEGGEYLYEPHFFHTACWADDVDAPMEEVLGDAEPVLDRRGIVECGVCTSDILSWELSGLLTIGEFQRSERAERSITFVPYQEQMEIGICASCLYSINEEVLELWEDGFTYGGCCPLGLELRCWRDGRVCNSPGGPECRLYNEL